MFSVRYQATAGGSPGHAQQVSGSRYRATARTDTQKKISTLNVNTLYQAGMFDDLIKEVERMKLYVIGNSEAGWIRSEQMSSKLEIFYHSGGEKHDVGKGILNRRDLSQSDNRC